MGEKFHDLELGKDFLGEKLKALTIKEKRIILPKLKIYASGFWSGTYCIWQSPLCPNNKRVLKLTF